ncbi:MAG: glutamate 5-kinase [Methylococcales bacterium]|nr:glutamate 5-kinase [Methylococcales bacterium]
MSRSEFTNAKRIVVKIGSSLLTAGGQGLNKPAITAWVEQMTQLKLQGKDIILVSSGAVAEGMARLKLKQRPKKLHELQAAAAVGQMGLVRIFENKFQKHALHTAQILLTHDDLSDRKRYLNARNTLLALLDFQTIPVINENDTVATDEIRFGDNDTLAALVANLVEADLLIILTDQQGLFDADPSINPEAILIEQADVNDHLLDEVAGESHSGLGRGGMFTKVSAARLASRSGTATVIVSGEIEGVISKIVNGEGLGTYLMPTLAPLVARKHWLTDQLPLAGTLKLKDEAVNRLRASKNLLATHVITASGEFKRGDLISCIDTHGKEIARGLINYNAPETLKIIGLRSQEFEKILGYADDDALINKNNMVIIK